MINCFLWICKYSASLGSHVSLLQCTAEWILFPFLTCGKKKVKSEENINGIEKGWQMDLIIRPEWGNCIVFENLWLSVFQSISLETENYRSHGATVILFCFLPCFYLMKLHPRGRQGTQRLFTMEMVDNTGIEIWPQSYLVVSLALTVIGHLRKAESRIHNAMHST